MGHDQVYMKMAEKLESTHGKQNITERKWRIEIP